MPWFDHVFEEILVPSAARTANGSIESGENYGQIDKLRAELQVTAAGGVSPTLNVVLETTVDGVDWDTVGTFAQKTAVSREVIQVNDLVGRKLRARWTVGGATPSFTFSVTLTGE